MRSLGLRITGWRVMGTSAAALALTAGLIVADFSDTPPALAWEADTCRGWGGTIDVRITANEAPTLSLLAAAEKWEPNTTGFNFEPAATVETRDMWASNKNFGPTGWLGVFRDYNNINSAPNCYNNRWSANAMVSINNYYDASYPARRQATAVHEFGHYLGLAHEDRAIPCPTGGTKNLAIMATSANYNGCTIYGPQTDDITGVNALY